MTETYPQQVFRCPDCGRVLLVVMDADDPDLPAEMATKIDQHKCEEGR